MPKTPQTSFTPPQFKILVSWLSYRFSRFPFPFGSGLFTFYIANFLILCCFDRKSQAASIDTAELPHSTQVVSAPVATPSHVSSERGLQTYVSFLSFLQWRPVPGFIFSGSISSDWPLPSPEFRPPGDVSWLGQVVRPSQAACDFELPKQFWVCSSKLSLSRLKL